MVVIVKTACCDEIGGGVRVAIKDHQRAFGDLREREPQGASRSTRFRFTRVKDSEGLILRSDGSLNQIRLMTRGENDLGNPIGDELIQEVGQKRTT